MNNFNLDQNPQILNSPESPERGAGQQVPSTQLGGETLIPSQEQVGEALDDKVGVGEKVKEQANSGLDIESLSSLINQAAEAVQKGKEQASFEVDPDTGLSLQGARIEELKAKLEDLQKGEISEIDNPILAERSKDKEILLANLAAVNNDKITIDNQIQATGENLEDLMKVSPKLGQKLALLQSQLTEAEQSLVQYEEETTRQLLEARQSAESKLKNELASTQEAYVGSEAELSDRKILLEMGLQDNLTNPEQLFSEQNIQQVLATYGLQEGMDRLQQLQTESNEAREQDARAKIQKDRFNYSFDYQNNSDLAQALNQDIEAQLQALQEQNPNSEAIFRALELKGKDRLDYLTNSKDPELQKLAFWFSEGRGDKTEAEIITDNPNFAKYVEQQTKKIYAKQQQDIKEGRLGGRNYLGSEADRQLQQEIDTRIEDQFTRAKADKLQALTAELTSLQSDEYGNPFDSLDQSMSSDRANLRPAEIDKFQAELAQALQDGRVKFEKGTFSPVENIPAKNAEIEQELDTLLNTVKTILEAQEYNIQSLAELSDILKKINQDKETAENKLFGRGKKKAASLESLAGVVSEAIEKYNQLQTEKQSNITKFQESIDSQDNLQQAYNKLPKSIQDKLSNLESPSLDTITQALESGVGEIQSYETPSEISERREQISNLKSQIAETEAITVPASKTNT